VVVIIWWCDLQLHMSCITEIQGAVVIVIIWCCDLQLHMSCITEIQEAVESHHHLITITTALCISVIYDICSCKSNHHMITTTPASCISVIYYRCSCKSPVVVVIIWWCDLQLHMSCITEIQHEHDGYLYFSNTCHM
jgi:hypothetical protein